jgi:cobalt-zinc-cadmium efflux system protein
MSQQQSPGAPARQKDHQGHHHQVRDEVHDHGDHHDHGHGHGHGPHEVQAGAGFALAIGLNAVFVGVEFFYGWAAESTALMADAGHNLSDVLGLVLAWGAVLLARKSPNERFTYGLRNSSVLAAMLNAMLLLVACGGIAWEAAQRLLSQPEVATTTVTVVAAIGLVINGLSAWLFMKGNKEDLNRRGAYLHMLADALVSLGVVVAGLAMKFTGWYWLDPLGSLVIVTVIVMSTWGLLRESFQLALQSVPKHVNTGAVSRFLETRPGVTGIHDLHIWALSTTETALSVHLVMPEGYPGDSAMDDIAITLRQQFKIQHSTLQMEQGTTHHACALSESPSRVVIQHHH